nr:hypothetical protein [Tanacetum cinerariifolium]
MALLSMRADKFWKRTGKKIRIQGSDVAGFDKSKVECFNCHKMGHFARESRAPRNQERVRKESYRQGSKAEEKSSKALMAIDRVGWDWSYMANEEDHALVVDGETPIEFALMANNENKKDLLWTGLPEFMDDTMTDYSRPSPTVPSTSLEDQNKDTSTSKESSTHRSAGHRPNGAHMRPPLRSSSPRPHGNSMRPPFRPAVHRPHGPSMNPRRPTMNGMLREARTTLSLRVNVATKEVSEQTR